MAHDWKRFPELRSSEMADLYFESPHKQITENIMVEVVKVTDGDTIRVQWSERDFVFPVRFLNINAPEMSEGGSRARDWLKGQIEGEMVELQIDPKQRVGKYGRLLASIYYRGLDMGEQEVYLGISKPFDQRKEGEVILDLGDQEWA